ncbi:hypothetical protein [uncultured Citrobacter sp.]|uniref:hypothetical protein n=1 Tax=uncultured Citrobacter sp. TaxID=200446 RepID=UPI00259A9C28|nr:hypothetical protein [uncultured Citrobacter sp.]
MKVVQTFKKGDLVTWSSQAAGSWKTKTGTVVDVMTQRGKPDRYVVVVPPKPGSTAKPKKYFPRTSALKKVETAA